MCFTSIFTFAPIVQPSSHPRDRCLIGTSPSNFKIGFFRTLKIAVQLEDRVASTCVLISILNSVPDWYKPLVATPHLPSCLADQPVSARMSQHTLGAAACITPLHSERSYLTSPISQSLQCTSGTLNISRGRDAAPLYISS